MNYSALRHLLWRQPLDNPPVTRLSCVTKTVVEPVGAALPELDALRREHITAPVGRAGYFILRKARFDFAPVRLQLRPISHDFALSRSPRREPAADWPGLKICCRFHGGKFAHFSGNTDLSFQICPIKHQRRLRVFGQLLPLAAVIV